VLRDVLYGYVSPEGAARDYGVAVEYTGRPDALVRMPGDYRIDRAATERLRAGR
jgi:N-methylhydantoinase B